MSPPRLPLVGIGLFIDVDWSELGSSVVHRTKVPADRWLAWRGDPETGDLVVATFHRQTGTRADDDRHQRFHDAPVSELAEVSWDPPQGRTLRPVGLCHAVRYRIPDGMASNKAGSDWRHAFGEAEPGVVRHENRWKPWLSRDARGGLYFVRRSGNDYRLDNWLRG